MKTSRPSTSSGLYGFAFAASTGFTTSAGTISATPPASTASAESTVKSSARPSRIRWNGGPPAFLACWKATIPKSATKNAIAKKSGPANMFAAMPAPPKPSTTIVRTIGREKMTSFQGTSGAGASGTTFTRVSTTFDQSPVRARL